MYLSFLPFICRNLIHSKDMDLYDKSRSLVYIGPVMRRLKSDTGFTEKWTDLVAALLDNYCQICLSLYDKPL